MQGGSTQCPLQYCSGKYCLLSSESEGESFMALHKWSFRWQRYSCTLASSGWDFKEEFLFCVVWSSRVTAKGVWRTLRASTYSLVPLSHRQREIIYIYNQHQILMAKYCLWAEPHLEADLSSAGRCDKIQRGYLGIFYLLKVRGSLNCSIL